MERFLRAATAAVTVSVSPLRSRGTSTGRPPYSTMNLWLSSEEGGGGGEGGGREGEGREGEGREGRVRGIEQFQVFCPYHLKLDFS